MAAVDRIPVTVIGGYLGAGKTTVLNNLLAGSHGLRLAVLVNDFGAVNIDAELIARHDGDTISLTNGCVCCAIADDLGQALATVAERAPAPDHIVIEASGVADPAKIAYYGQGWPGLCLDAVVTIVDGETIRARSRDKFVGRLVIDQLTAADIIVVNKIDLVASADRDDLRRWLAARVSAAVCVEVEFGALAPDLLLSSEPSAKSGQPTVAGETDHAALFATAVFTESRPTDPERLAAALDAMPPWLLRAKGTVYSGADPARRHILQLVGRRWTLTPGAAWGDEVPATTLVMIGLKASFDADELRRRLAAAG
jgi:G3E family GTPase